MMSDIDSNEKPVASSTCGNTNSVFVSQRLSAPKVQNFEWNPYDNRLTHPEGGLNDPN